MENWLLEIDPTLIQFRLGCRVLLSLVCVSLALVVVNLFLPLSHSAAAIGLVTTLQGTVAVRDETPWARAVTRAYSAVAGFGVICVITFLEHRLLAVNAVMLCVIALAVYAPHFGDRWKAVGLFAFFCCILSGFLKPVDGELTGIAVSLVVSTVISHLVRNYILPERPADDFRRAVRAVSTLVREFEGQGRHLAVSKHPARELRKLAWMRRKARNALGHAEEYLPLDASPEAAALAGRLFDLRLAIDGCMAAVRGVPAAPSDLQPRLAVLERIRLEIMQSVSAIPDSIFTAPRAKAAPKRAGTLMEDPQFRQAVQVTLASAIALPLGLILSHERWFWAVMTAFLVFTNTHSTGETLVRALNRTLGTAIGIVAGIALATFLDGAFLPTIVLTALSIMIAYFLMAESYTVFCVFLTIAISLVYGLVGAFTPHLLVIRLEETGVGAAAGILVSLLAFPTRTQDRLATVFRSFLRAIDALLALFCDPAHDEVAITRQLRAIEAAHADCQTTLAPLQSAWKIGPRSSGPREAVMRVDALRHSMEALARAFASHGPTPDQVARISDIRREIGALQDENVNILAAAPYRPPSALPGSADFTEVDRDLQRLMLTLGQLDTKSEGAQAAS
ncbi:FUSC family protein [Enterovirga sp. CN4-39]|uniref:FUSC family protein n=1 Tax=Enterovirga sp. CN4-39 TaxID=3400910 RepID=UPI003C11D071